MTPSKNGTQTEGISELREEIGSFLNGVVQGWADKAGDKVTGLTQRPRRLDEMRTADRYQAIRQQAVDQQAGMSPGAKADRQIHLVL